MLCTSTRWHFLGVMALLGWGFAIGFGFRWLHGYEVTPGLAGRPVVAWPSDMPSKPAAGTFAVFMAVHPRCPCTQASLRVLAEILRKHRGQVPVQLLVYRPRGSSLDWPGTSWRRSIESAPGISYQDDPGAEVAQRFGLKTSGAVVMFDESGKVRFLGGITEGRGQEGVSESAIALSGQMTGTDANRATCQVFGCPLVADSVGFPSGRDRP